MYMESKATHDVMVISWFARGLLFAVMRWLTHSLCPGSMNYAASHAITQQKKQRHETQERKRLLNNNLTQPASGFSSPQPPDFPPNHTALSKLVFHLSLGVHSFLTFLASLFVLKEL